VRAKMRAAENRFLWRYFYLLMLSHGIFLSYEQLRKLRYQYEQEDLAREFAKLDPSARKTAALEGLAMLDRLVARTGPLPSELVALRREYEAQVNDEPHKLNGGSVH